MSFSKLKSAFFGETVVRTHEYDIQRFIARADPQGLRKYLQKNPQAIQNSIGPFQKAKFSNNMVVLVCRVVFSSPRKCQLVR